jgi:hypothetical protein
VHSFFPFFELSVVCLRFSFIVPCGISQSYRMCGFVHMQRGIHAAQVHSEPERAGQAASAGHHGGGLHADAVSQCAY